MHVRQKGGKMGFSSISEVGNHIVSILRRELVPDVVLHTGAIGLCSPEDHGDFTIGVYLYDISPNNDLVERRMVAVDRRTQVYPSSFLFCLLNNYINFFVCDAKVRFFIHIPSKMMKILTFGSHFT